MSKKAKIMLVAYGAGHINVIISMYRELASRGHDLTVIGLTMARKKLTDEGIPFLGYTDFLTDDDSKALELGEQLLAGIATSEHIPHEESVAYMGICYSELIELHGDTGAQRLYQEQGRQAFLPRNFMGRILDSIQPDLVIATNSPRSEEAVIREAHVRDIPAYCIVDFYYCGTDIEDRLGDRDYAKKMFVSFKNFKQILIEAGRTDDQVEVCGNPVFDSLAAFPMAKHRSSIRRKFDWDERFVVLWIQSISETFKEVEKSVENLLESEFSKRHDVQVVYRPHPNDVTVHNSHWRDEVYVSSSDDPLHEMVAACDVVVTVISTVGLEANLLGKPVIQVEFIDYGRKIPFPELGIGKAVYSLEQLSSELSRLSSRDNSSPDVTPCFPIGDNARTIATSIENDYFSAHP